MIFFALFAATPFAVKKSFLVTHETILKEAKAPDPANKRDGSMSLETDLSPEGQRRIDARIGPLAEHTAFVNMLTATTTNSKDLRLARYSEMRKQSGTKDFGRSFSQTDSENPKRELSPANVRTVKRSKSLFAASPDWETVSNDSGFERDWDTNSIDSDSVNGSDEMTAEEKKLNKYLRYIPECTRREEEGVHVNVRWRGNGGVVQRNAGYVTHEFQLTAAKTERDVLWKAIEDKSNGKVHESLSKMIRERYNIEFDVDVHKFKSYLDTLLVDAYNMIEDIRNTKHGFAVMSANMKRHLGRDPFKLRAADKTKGRRTFNLTTLRSQVLMDFFAEHSISPPHLPQIDNAFGLFTMIGDVIELCEGRVSEDQAKAFIQDYLPSSTEATDYAPVLSTVLSKHNHRELLHETHGMKDEKYVSTNGLLRAMYLEYVQKVSEEISLLANNINQGEYLEAYAHLDGEKTKAFRFYRNQMRLLPSSQPSSGAQASQFYNVIVILDLLLDKIPAIAGIPSEPSDEKPQERSCPKKMPELNRFWQTFRGFRRNESTDAYTEKACPTQDSDITDKDTCSKAASYLNYTYIDILASEHHPKNCFAWLHEASGTTYVSYNSHVTGKSQSSTAKPICTVKDGGHAYGQVEKYVEEKFAPMNKLSPQITVVDIKKMSDLLSSLDIDAFSSSSSIDDCQLREVVARLHDRIIVGGDFISCNPRTDNLLETEMIVWNIVSAEAKNTWGSLARPDPQIKNALYLLELMHDIGRKALQD